MFAELLSLLSAWPTDVNVWLDSLPAASSRQRRIESSPGPGTHWVETRIQGPWPPERYVVNRRDRIPDQIMARTLRWVLDEVVSMRRDAVKVDPSLKNELKSQMAAAVNLLKLPPISDATGQMPTVPEVRSLRVSGAPWTVLASVASYLRDSHSTSLMEFARRHLMPVQEVRWRLFHLGVLGVLLKSFLDDGWTLKSMRPLSASLAGGPHYKAVSENGVSWDLWFESESMWSYYGEQSSYQALTMEAFGRESPMGADIALVRPGDSAHLFECKFGDAAYVSRDGYHQISTYMSEVKEKIAPAVAGYVVGPDEVVVSKAAGSLSGSPVHIVGPRHMEGFKPRWEGQ